MELSPQSVASTTFKTVKKGYDPDEVRAYLAQLATAIEGTQSQAAAMEARARAAVARLQEIAAQPATAVAPGPTAIVAPVAAVEESETISRTLLLAQRTADTTIAEAEGMAARIREDAEAEARYAVDNARETQVRLIEEAKAEARKAGEGQRIQIESEVQALLARREFLLSDVEHLEQHVITHRERLRDVAGALTELVDNANGGLSELRRPLMSAVNAADAQGVDADPDATMAMERVDPSTPVTDDPADDADTAAATEPAVTADRPLTDATPAFGSELSFDDITSEVPQVQRRENDAFRVGGSNI